MALPNRKTFNKTIDSAVLRRKGAINKEVDFIYECLQQPTKLQLLYRASDHGFKVDAFHAACDTVNDTLVLLRTEAGKTIGGYSLYRWGHKEDLALKKINTRGGTYVIDANRRTFLLQLDLLQKLIPLKDSWLIFCHNKFGPVFGEGVDLWIGDNCNSGYKSGCRVGETYNINLNGYVKDS